MVNLQSLKRLYALTDDQYVIPIDSINSELEQLKHAIFTEPKDQSAWNYHRWLITLVKPVQVVSLRHVEGDLVVSFSHII